MSTKIVGYRKWKQKIEKNTRTLHDGNKILTNKRIAFKEYVIVGTKVNFERNVENAVQRDILK